MVGKIFKTLLTLIIVGVILSAASIAGVNRDYKRQQSSLEEQQAEIDAEAEPELMTVTSPYEPYTGGVLDLQMDYEAQLIGNDVLISLVSNLPNSYELTAELSNIEAVKLELGLENVSSSTLTPEQMTAIDEKKYSQKEKNFVTDGVCEFIFENPPSGTLDLKITSPITKLQPQSVQEQLGDKGVNLQGAYVVFLEEVADKSINFNASFEIEETGVGGELPAPEQSE